MFSNVYRDKRVLITGHTGFKGSWLAFWLLQLGAKVCGYSNEVPTSPANFSILSLQDRLRHEIGDVRDKDRLRQVFDSFRPEIVFHLAAQALVRKAYDEPATTFETNAMGTLNVLECIRWTSSVRTAVLITSDKCYRNVEWTWGYRENDRLGGEDPYSASKGCAELIIYSYVQSFFSDGPFVASARAGNVVGGGDWAADRIIPDAVRAWADNKPVCLRNPRATRPWQHVLEPLSGYLWLGACLWTGKGRAHGEAFNFGPDAKVNQSVATLLNTLSSHWPGAHWEEKAAGKEDKTESTLLKLSCDKSLNYLGWHAVLGFEETVALTAKWYRTYYANPSANMNDFAIGQLERYIERASEARLPWSI